MSEHSVFDEMWGRDAQIRAPYQNFFDWFDQEDPKRLRAKNREAEELFRLTGITFNVYGRSEAEERLIPFDIIDVTDNLGRAEHHRGTGDAKPQP